MVPSAVRLGRARVRPGEPDQPGTASPNLPPVRPTAGAPGTSRVHPTPLTARASPGTLRYRTRLQREVVMGNRTRLRGQNQSEGRQRSINAKGSEFGLWQFFVTGDGPPPSCTAGRQLSRSSTLRRAVRSSAMSTIMSSWPPTSLRRPDLDAGSSRTSTPYRSAARLGVAQEAGVDPGVAERQRLAVDPHRPVLQRADQVVGRVLQRRTGRSRAPSRRASATATNASSGQLPAPAPMPGQRGVDPVDALFDRGQRVGHGEREVVVGVDADLGGRVEHVAVGAHPRRAPRPWSGGRRSR